MVSGSHCRLWVGPTGVFIVDTGVSPRLLPPCCPPAHPHWVDFWTGAMMHLLFVGQQLSHLVRQWH